MFKTTLLSFLILASTLTVQAKNAPTKKFEVRTAPLAYLAQWTTIDIAIAVTDQISVGPAFINYGASGPYGNMFLPTLHGTAYGLNANYYIDSILVDSWYLGLHAFKEKFDSYPHAYLGSYTYDGSNIIATIGYREVSPTGLTVMFGAGARRFDYAKTEKPDYSAPVSSNESGNFLYLEFKAGYLF